MSILNQVPKPPQFDGDPYVVAERLMDLIFPGIHDYDPINFQSIIQKSNLSNTDKALASHLADKIEILMYSKFFYAERIHPSNFYGCLTPLGRQVKSAGGHIAYLDKVKKQKEAELTRQSLSDKKLIQDLINAEFDGKQGRKIKRWTFRIAVATFLLTLVGSTLINQFFFSGNTQTKKNNHDINQGIIDTLKNEVIQTKQQLQELKQALQKDTAQKK